jgi:hypothetical protein
MHILHVRMRSKMYTELHVHRYEGMYCKIKRTWCNVCIETAADKKQVPSLYRFLFIRNAVYQEAGITTAQQDHLHMSSCLWQIPAFERACLDHLMQKWGSSVTCEKLFYDSFTLSELFHTLSFKNISQPSREYIFYRVVRKTLSYYLLRNNFMQIVLGTLCN